MSFLNLHDTFNESKQRHQEYLYEKSIDHELYPSMICPSCNSTHPPPIAVTPGTIPQLGDLFLCPECAEVSCLGPTGWVVLSADDWAKLPPDEIKDIQFAIRNIQQHHQNTKNIQQ